jgi:hypothetical protein
MATATAPETRRVRLLTAICGLIGPVPAPGQDDTRKAFDYPAGHEINLPVHVAEAYCTLPVGYPRAEYVEPEDDDRISTEPPPAPHEPNPGDDSDQGGDDGTRTAAPATERERRVQAPPETR